MSHTGVFTRQAKQPISHRNTVWCSARSQSCDMEGSSCLLDPPSYFFMPLNKGTRVLLVTIIHIPQTITVFHLPASYQEQYFQVLPMDWKGHERMILWHGTNCFVHFSTQPPMITKETTSNPEAVNTIPKITHLQISFLNLYLSE